MTDAWTCRHFSLANPRGPGATDLPLLLRRVADHIEEMGLQSVDVLHPNVDSEITEDGPWWSVTVYWAPKPLGLVSV